MFEVEKTTISMSIGDTGAVKVRTIGHQFNQGTPGNPYDPANPADIALFTIKAGNGNVLMERKYTPDTEGYFLVCFHSQDTKGWPQGNYQWDVRFLIHPYYDANHNIVDVDQVLTPYNPMQFVLRGTVGTV